MTPTDGPVAEPSFELARGLPETRTAFDPRPVHEAAAASTGELWELPKPPEGTEYGWFGCAG